MSNVIRVGIKNNYGKETMYVISEHPYAVAQLTGKKTIDRRDIEALKQLGFTVVLPATETISL